MKHFTPLSSLRRGQSSLSVPIVVYVLPPGAPNKTGGFFCKRKKRAGFGTPVGVQFEALAGEGSWRPRPEVWAGFGTVNTVIFFPLVAVGALLGPLGFCVLFLLPDLQAAWEPGGGSRGPCRPADKRLREARPPGTCPLHTLPCICPFLYLSRSAESSPSGTDLT